MRQHLPWLGEIEHHTIELGIDNTRVDVAFTEQQVACLGEPKGMHVAERELNEVGPLLVADDLATFAYCAQ